MLRPGTDHTAPSAVSGRHISQARIPYPTLLEYTVALSELYNQRVLEEICADLNLATTPCYPTAGHPVMEPAGTPEDLIDWAATRNEATMQRLGELVAQYRSRTSQPAPRRSATA
ncbi:hypothetical protein [Streptomyces sp. NPDC005969]|uniref:hypothetical protein n=1 Tax=Streptomyces sp. NPDC005969 TaxID=3156722 RepID=UPI0033DFC587